MSQSSQATLSEFDLKWYCETYPDVGLSGIEPRRHYLEYGIRLGRKPSPAAKPGSQIARNPGKGAQKKIAEAQASDAAGVSMNPATKLRDGEYFIYEDLHQTKIALFPAPCFERIGHNVKPYPESPCLVTPYQGESLANVSEPDLGIHLHLFYVDLLPEMISFLRHIPFRFSVYVSVTDESQENRVEKTLKEALPKASITVKSFENRGRDIAAFVCGFGQDLATHEYIAHIHTKRSPHNQAKADWRRQLMTYLMGSESIIASTFRRFQTSHNIGMIFPVYHHSLRQQVSWGTNFAACETLAKRMCLQVDPNRMIIFPAGSMFWARTKALKPLLETCLSFADFPEEEAQVDGTPAHAVERLLGEVVNSQGFDLLQTRPDKPFNLLGYHSELWPYFEPENVAELVQAYQRERKNDNRTVVFTAMSGGYDQPVIHEYLDPAFDYLIFTDGPIDDRGFWQVRPMDWFHPETVRMARRIKTNPHTYLQGYDWAIWIDANVIIRGDMRPAIDQLKQQKDIPLAAIPHPLRNCIHNEATTVIKSGKDASGRAQRQMNHYNAEGYPRNNGLIESNLMVINLGHPATAKLMSEWSSQIGRYSHRDQLSLNYVLWKTKSQWQPLMSENQSLRQHNDYAYLGHGKNSGYRRAIRQPESRQVDPYSLNMKPAISATDVSHICVDIIVCVHDALEETKTCLKSVAKAMREGDRIIVVDDASDSVTVTWLETFLRRHKGILLRNEGVAQGYCKAANKGMSASHHPYFLLLNSDTILTREALENMLRTATYYAQCGIVGPMSNAASFQSIPSIQGSSGQTAVNALPKAHSIEDMNRLCQSWAHPELRPAVPLVHGFCQLISKEVYERIGGFDEQSFPHGYGEENDFCLRAADSGFDLRIATDAYVFHVKSASYKDAARRQELLSSGNRKLKEKHGEDRLKQAILMMKNNPFLIRMREHSQMHYEGSDEP